MRLRVQVSNLKITASSEINSSYIIKKSKPVTVPWETKQLQRLLFKNNNSFLMKAIVAESKFRAVTNSFLPLGDEMLIKTDYGPVNSLMVLFLWAGSTNLSCFPFKTKKIWYTKRALKGVKRAVMGKGHSSKTRKVSKSSTASPNKSQRRIPRCHHRTLRDTSSAEAQDSTAQRAAPMCLVFTGKGAFGKWFTIGKVLKVEPRRWIRSCR